MGDCGCDLPVIPRSNFRIEARQCVLPFFKFVVEDNKHNRRKNHSLSLCSSNQIFSSLSCHFFALIDLCHFISLLVIRLFHVLGREVKGMISNLLRS